MIHSRQTLGEYTSILRDEMIDDDEDGEVNETMLTQRGRPNSNRRCVIGVSVLCGACCIALGVIIGWFSHDYGSTAGNGNQINTQQRIQDGVTAILQNMDKVNIKDNLRNYTRKPRLPGSEFSLQLSEELAHTWRENGLDVVHVPTYDVLLSYPNKSEPNSVEIIFKNGTSTGIKSAAFEKPLDPDGNSTDVVPPYNAFSPRGVAEGDLVYVNYGRIEDFTYLVHNLSMDLTGTIGIARYGKVFRGDKVKNAMRFSMTGMVMYTDPSDFNIDNSSTYPDSWWMPDTGVQRGTIGADGDYLTPLYPATDYAYRKKKEDVLTITIPAQPISYGDAQKFLSQMKGKVAPADWQGKLPIEYKIGPGFTDSNLKAKLTVNNYEKLTPVKNVIGYIKGKEEPDRYVLMGNHHDAWVFGAIDPLSGTAIVTELTRVFGNLLKQGIRPRRTIVFCSWGAEEPGLIGSTEWVEEHMKVLYERAVAYLNVDYAVDYPHHLSVAISPLLQDPMYLAAKKVPNPQPSSEFPTLYDIWNSRAPGKDNQPHVDYSLGSGSDQATFYQRAGVSSTDFWYSYDENKWDILSYPLYHSAYETFHMYTEFIDSSFNYTLSMGHLLGVLAWDLANEDILQFNVTRYSTAVTSFIKSLETQFGAVWTTHKVNIESLNSAAHNFTTATQAFHGHLSSVDTNSIIACRIVNDKMMQLERAFIDPEGLPGRPMYKHVMFAPSQFDSYSDNSFPGIMDTMYEIQHNNADSWDMLKQQVYVATYIIQSAAETLKNIGL